ncbi:16073_t:CDS:1, partial [Acaulospora morrowiae]
EKDKDGELVAGRHFRWAGPMWYAKVPRGVQINTILRCMRSGERGNGD